MIEGDSDSYKKTLSIIEKYFSPGLPLDEERKLIDTLRLSSGLSERASHSLVEEVRQCAKRLDSHLIEIKKSNLIKDINYTFGKDFFNMFRVREYRTYASIQLLIEQYKNGSYSKIDERAERVKLEESVVKYLTSSRTLNEEKKGDVDSLVASLAMKKFEERYGKALNEDQKRIVRKYLNFQMTGNAEKFSKEIEQERSTILESLKMAQGEKEFRDDTTMAANLKASIQALQGLQNLTEDKSIQDILLYQSLVNEVHSNE